MACVVWSLSSIITGYCDSFGLLVAMRALLGMAAAAADPTGYSMIADTFKPNQIGLANSVWTAAPYLGGGLCALNIIFNQLFGWRNTLMGIGGIGVLIGLLNNFFVKEPKRAI